MELTPLSDPARTSGITTPFTSRMRSSMASNGCSGITVAEVELSRSGWRCMRAKTWAFSLDVRAPSHLVRTAMDTLLRAILNDDRARAKELLKADRSLATCRIDEARLYKS